MAACDASACRPHTALVFQATAMAHLPPPQPWCCRGPAAATERARRVDPPPPPPPLRATPTELRLQPAAASYWLLLAAARPTPGSADKPCVPGHVRACGRVAPAPERARGGAATLRAIEGAYERGCKCVSGPSKRQVSQGSSHTGSPATNEGLSRVQAITPTPALSWRAQWPCPVRTRACSLAHCALRRPLGRQRHVRLPRGCSIAPGPAAATAPA